MNEEETRVPGCLKPFGHVTVFLDGSPVTNRWHPGRKKCIEMLRTHLQDVRTVRSDQYVYTCKLMTHCSGHFTMVLKIGAEICIRLSDPPRDEIT